MLRDVHAVCALRSNVLDIRQVRSFIAVAHALNFSRAAKQLNLSQPALSAQVKALESHLNAELLERNRRSVRLTTVGAAFLLDAEALLEQIRDIELRVASISSGDIGHLRIGFVASATLEIVPAIAVAFRRQYPRVSLDLKNLPTVGQVEALRNGTLDAGFVRMPLAEKGISVVLVHREPFAIVVAKSHPLAREKKLAVSQLAGEKFISYGRQWAPAFYESWTGICRNAGYMPNVVQETAEMSTALALVSAGLGVAIVPEGITRGHRGRVAVTTLRREKIQSEIGMASISDRQSPLLRHLMGIAKQVAQRRF